MIEPQPQAFGAIINGAVVSLAGRMRVRRLPEKRARVKHNRITMAQATNAREAWLFAIREGVPLNVFATANWGHAPAHDDGPQHPVDRNAKLRDALEAWIYRNSLDKETGKRVPFVWIEVREKTRADGEHVHLFAHVPDHLREGFTQAFDRLVARQSVSLGSTATKTVAVGPKWWDRFAYAMKGGTDEVRDRFMDATQRSRWSQRQGTIEGARLRIAHSIGPMARKASENAADGHSSVSAVA
jgi:hypothetical protein